MEAGSEEEAFFFQRMAEMMRGYHESVSPARAVTPAIVSLQLRRTQNHALECRGSLYSSIGAMTQQGCSKAQGPGDADPPALAGPCGVFVRIKRPCTRVVL